MNSFRIVSGLRRGLLHLVLGLGGITMLGPFLWMISSSLKGDNELYAIPPTIIPHHIIWENYAYVFQSAPWNLYFANTFKITLLVVLGQLLVCSMGAYAFARLRFPGRDLLFVVYLGTMMIPGQVTLIPNFVIIKNLGWVNTHYALIVPGLFSAFGTFLLRQFFLTIPQELEQSAMIDGCSYPRIYWSMILPLAMPALTTLAIFTFMGTWNDFFGPLIYLNDEELKTLTLGLAHFQGLRTTQWSYLMGASLMSMAPILVVFAFAQRYFVESIAMSGLKG